MMRNKIAQLMASREVKGCLNEIESAIYGGKSLALPVRIPIPAQTGLHAPEHCAGSLATRGTRWCTQLPLLTTGSARYGHTLAFQERRVCG